MRKSSIAFKMSTIRCGYWYVLLLLLLLPCCSCCCCCSAVQRTVSWILHVAIYLLIYFAFACKQTKHKFAQCHLPIANWHCPDTHTHTLTERCLFSFPFPIPFPFLFPLSFPISLFSCHGMANGNVSKVFAILQSIGINWVWTQKYFVNRQLCIFSVCICMCICMCVCVCVRLLGSSQSGHKMRRAICKLICRTIHLQNVLHKPQWKSTQSGSGRRGREWGG